jgi:hypothetical protein
MKCTQTHAGFMTPGGYRNIFRGVVLLIAAGIIFFSSLLTSCRSTKPEIDTPDVDVTITLLDKVLIADTLNTTQVWVVVKQGKMLAPDSTAVTLATNLGTVSESILTKDGLATGVYRASSEPGIGSIVAYSLGEKDTITVILN